MNVENSETTRKESLACSLEVNAAFHYKRAMLMRDKFMETGDMYYRRMSINDQTSAAVYSLQVRVHRGIELRSHRDSAK